MSDPWKSDTRKTVAVLVVLVLVVAAILFWPATHDVLVVGDSITVQSAGPIRDALDNDYNVRIVALSGQRVDQMLGPVGKDVHDHGAASATIVNLGTNDGNQLHPMTFESYLLMLEQVRNSPCVVLVTINPLALKGSAATLNEKIRTLAASNQRYKLVDWEKVLQQHHDYVNTIDAIHPTKAGQLALARLYRDAVESCP